MNEETKVVIRGVWPKRKTELGYDDLIVKPENAEDGWLTAEVMLAAIDHPEMEFVSVSLLAKEWVGDLTLDRNSKEVAKEFVPLVGMVTRIRDFETTIKVDKVTGAPKCNPKGLPYVSVNPKDIGESIMVSSKAKKAEARVRIASF